jgi:Uncharacterised protein family (UPF0236)
LATVTWQEIPVELMVACPLVLPDSPLDLAQLEAAVHAWGLEIQQQALAQAWQAQAALRPAAPCPQCGGTDLRRAGHKPRHVETCFGPVRLSRPRVCCRGCRRHSQPDDAVLASVLGQGRCTPALRELVTNCGVSWPYQQAARVVGRLRGAPLSAETIRTVVAHAGSAVAAQQAREAQTACQPPAAPQLSGAPPARLVVELDGAWVHSHDNALGMEAKLGVVHAGRERIGRTRTRLTARRYAATFAGVSEFGPLVTAEVVHGNGYEAPEQTLLGDGAAWIWTLGAHIVAEATPVLDRWHLADARRRTLRQAVGEAEQRAAWAARLEPCLERGDVPGALAVLAELSHSSDAPVVAEFAAFLTRQAPHIPDYAARRAAGLPIGSGGVEKGVDVVVNRRFKGKRGMKWGRARAEGVLALRVAEGNDEWLPRLTPALGLPAQLPAF